MNNMPEYTIRDIAKMAGVSVGTVSRILNHADNVSEDIRSRTLDIIAKVNYQAAPRGRRAVKSSGGLKVAVSVKTARRNIALLLPGVTREWMHNQLWMAYLSGIESAMHSRNGRLTIFTADSNPADVAGEIIGRADGVLLKVQSPVPEYVKEIMSHLPVVGFGIEKIAAPIPQVVIDNNFGGVIATEKLLELGHTRIAFVNHENRNYPFIARSNGYVEVMKKHALYDPAYLFELPGKDRNQALNPEKTPPDLDCIVEAMQKLQHFPTAAVVANDWGAFGLMRSCEKYGIKIPQQLSVIGMDTSGNLCDILQPALSSVEMPFAQAAEFAAHTLLDILDNIGSYKESAAAVMNIPGKLILRDSVKEYIS